MRAVIEMNTNRIFYADSAFRCLKHGIYLGISGDECNFFQNLRVILRAAVLERIDVWISVLKLI